MIKFDPTFPTPVINKCTFLQLFSKNASCNEFKALVLSFSSIIIEMFLSDAPCAIALILILLFPKVLNSFPLTPCLLFILSPTIAIFDKELSIKE